ncbi:hypothetical protein Q7A53_08255 [Halobacillus rhizosphaerae]|uniref:hypothetical protein n=1 Tax=Halobacillus rhizosphaerae TaxID=3064889 RepID=UPI00398A6D22
MLTILLVVAGVGSYLLFTNHSVIESKELSNGTNIKFRTNGEQLEVYQNKSWSPLFVKGVNLGATLPGHFPGELPITKEEYLDWFQMMKDMGVNTVRIYTIHEPVFYEALVEFNKDHKEDPLYFMQGVWSPVKLLNETQNAWSEKVTNAFKKELDHAIGAVYGDITLPDQPGKASGEYSYDASPYLLAWHIGTEWDPKVVAHTNEKKKGRPVFKGDKAAAVEEASPFESWLAELLNYTAKTEEKKGWQHPLTFTNWITTDPLKHPAEPLPTEDSVSVDATHIKVRNWKAGYFASFHAYPYYPDFLNQSDHQQQDSNMDSYEKYLKNLKQYHKGMPIMITEFGVPSSLGNAHHGPKGRDQGGHSEEEQGKMDAAMLKEIHAEDYAGAVLFSWQDEWFKKTWNTVPLVKKQSRPNWFNYLSPEMSFGLIAMDPEKNDHLQIDGSQKDWQEIDDKQKLFPQSNRFQNMWVTHDEGYVYVTAKLKQKFDPAKETLYFGVNTIHGGIKSPQALGNKKLDEGLETLIELGQNSEVRIASNYDFDQRLYEEATSTCGNTKPCFEPWRLAVSRKMEPPQANASLPFEDVKVGQLNRADAGAEKDQALWQVKGSVIEMKIPWALLGFADPSTHQVIGYQEKESGKNSLPTTTTKDLTFVPWIVDRSDGAIKGFDPHPDTISLSDKSRYQWENWEKVHYHERKKQGYDLMKKAFRSLN